MTKKTIDIDAEFDDVQFDEIGIKKITGIKRFYEQNPDKKRIGEKNPFYKKTHDPATIEYIKKINKGLHSGEKNPMYGKTHTEEVKQKSRDRNKIYYEKNGGTFLGKTHTEETKKIMREKRGTRATVELKPCYAIDPFGKRYDFPSITECVKILNYPSLNGNAHRLLPSDGTLWKVSRGKFKGWAFARII